MRHGHHQNYGENSMDNYQQYIHKSRYARYLAELKRREEWGESVERYSEFMSRMARGRGGFSLPSEAVQAIIDMEIMPSMRALMTAGDALEKDNVAGYNCSYLPINRMRAFDETLYILMCGVGIGFSVERQYIADLPEISENFYETDTVIAVRDSKIGWATAYKELLAMLWSGMIPKWDISRIRPAGSRLLTFGGRASGPDPLDRLFRVTIEMFKGASGRKLTSIECHDIMNYIGEAVVVGGVRRTAEISLSNHSDERMRNAKMGNWFAENPQRALANNSICYTERPDVGAFMREWMAIYQSGSGERGIFNRQACKNMVPERRDADWDFGTNPCSEIVLRPKQFCNLSEVVARPSDKMPELKEKVRMATILGTYQAMLTNFRYLTTQWKRNTEEEALLGVSITGIFDCPFLINSTNEELQELKNVAIETNKKTAKNLSINPATSITCVKPSGTVSQLVNSSSGIHPRYNDYYIRRVRNDKKDPLSETMINSGIPYITDPYNNNSWVFEFPMKSPTKALTRKNIGPITQLDIWKHFALNWCEHKPSMTCYVNESDWPEVGAWVWNNFDIMNGVSFLPSSDEGHIYEAAPYEDISKDGYKARNKEMPSSIDWSSIVEEEDFTTSSQELACTADHCEL